MLNIHQFHCITLTAEKGLPRTLVVYKWCRFRVQTANKNCCSQTIHLVYAHTTPIVHFSEKNHPAAYNIRQVYAATTVREVYTECQLFRIVRGSIFANHTRQDCSPTVRDKIVCQWYTTRLYANHTQQTAVYALCKPTTRASYIIYTHQQPRS